MKNYEQNYVIVKRSTIIIIKYFYDKNFYDEF